MFNKSVSDILSRKVPRIIVNKRVKNNAKTRSVTATYSDKASAVKIRKMNGVVFQKQDVVADNFLGTKATGRMLIQAN